jgi:hypothetical protein
VQQQQQQLLRALFAVLPLWLAVVLVALLLRLACDVQQERCWRPWLAAALDSSELQHAAAAAVVHDVQCPLQLRLLQQHQARPAPKEMPMCLVAVQHLFGIQQ